MYLLCQHLGRRLPYGSNPSCTGASARDEHSEHAQLTAGVVLFAGGPRPAGSRFGPTQLGLKRPQGQPDCQQGAEDVPPRTARPLGLRLGLRFLRHGEPRTFRNPLRTAPSAAAPGLPTHHAVTSARYGPTDAPAAASSSRANHRPTSSPCTTSPRSTASRRAAATVLASPKTSFDESSNQGTRTGRR